MLSDLLKRNPDIHLFDEVFNPAYIDVPAALLAEVGMRASDVDARDADPSAFSAKLLAAAGDRKAGLRVFPPHARSALRMIAWEKRTKKIILRRNALMSYSSWKIAKSTNLWFATKSTARNDVHAATKVKFDNNEFLEWQELEQAFLARFMVGQHIIVDYAELNTPQCLERLGVLLEIAHPAMPSDGSLWRVKLRSDDIEERFLNPDEVVSALRGTFNEGLLTEGLVSVGRGAPPAVAGPATLVNHAVYLDWDLNVRTGGPPGYLANLRDGLADAPGAESVTFLCREALAAAPDEKPATLPPTPLFAAPRWQVSEKYRSFMQFLSRPDRLKITGQQWAAMDRSRLRTMHAHTTIDAVKLHNSLVQIGMRHRVKLLLTSHCPELPAKEWAEGAYAEGLDDRTTITFFDLYREIDYLAFHVSDVLVFPSREAMEPYRQTMPDFDRLFGNRDIRFVASGAKPLSIDKSRRTVRRSVGLGDEFVICFLGRHNQVKGYDVLKRLAARLLDDDDNIAFLIGGRPGPIPPPDHPRWIEYGWTTTPGDLIAAADVFVLPNLSTFYDLVLLEVLSLGQIVVASATGGNRSFEGVSPGIILYQTTEDLLEVMRHLKSLPLADRRRMGDANAILYKAAFSNQVFAQAYLRTVGDIQRDYRLTGIALPTPDPDGTARPLISVIVPVYNVRDYLEECLESICRQTLTDLEIIVVNDGSTDDSQSIIDRFAAYDARIIPIVQSNKGLSGARNTGLDIARGEYISFVDSDDRLNLHMLERLHGACQQHGTALAVCGVRIFDATGYENNHSALLDETKLPRFIETGSVSIDVDTLTSMFPSAWNKLYKTSVLERIRYDQGLYYEDHPVFYKSFLSERTFAYVPEPLYEHRIDRKTRITLDGSRRVIDVFTIIDIVESIFSEYLGAADVAKHMTKIITRLVWERNWVVAEEGLRSLMFEYAVIRFLKLGTGVATAIELRDGFIGEDFVRDLFVRGTPSIDALHKRSLAIAERVKVAAPFGDNDLLPYPLVWYNKEEEYLLVHPQAGRITIGEISGLSTVGPTTLSFTVCLENAEAGDVEFAVFASPFKATDRIMFDNPADGWWSGQRQWERISAMQDRQVQMTIPQGSPTGMFYVCSRLPEDQPSMDFCWLRFRAINIT